MFIAASPRPQFLALAESAHRCRTSVPELLRDACCEARVVAYAFGMPLLETGFPLLHELVPLMGKLALQEPALDGWLRSSETNAGWFRMDPFAALRAANLGIEEELLQELESATRTIAQWLKPNS